MLKKYRIRSVPSDREGEFKKKCLILFFDPMNNFAAINYCNQLISAELQEEARGEAREVCGATATALIPCSHIERRESTCDLFIYFTHLLFDKSNKIIYRNNHHVKIRVILIYHDTDFVNLMKEFIFN